MSRYQNEEQAAAAGIRIVHEPESNRYVVYQDVAEEAQPRLIGRAHYTLLGDDAIDFDHTVVVPVFRGTGISGLLAHRAVTGEIAEGRRVHASCWFIAGYLAKHPELIGEAG